MFYFYDAFISRHGGALAGYYGRLRSQDGDPVPIFGDAMGTPILAMSGKEDAARTDESGMLRFYAPNGVFDLQLSNPDDQWVHTETGLQFFNAGDLIDDLASGDVGKGAALVAVEGGGTVQTRLIDLAEAIEALPAPSIGDMVASNNLSDLHDSGAARANLGLGAAALLSTADIDERARDAVGAALVAGENITITPNDAGDTLTITAAGGSVGYTDEDARDAIGAALVGGAGVTITPNDGANTITVSSTVTQYTDEMARDAFGAALTDTGLAVVTPNDGGDTIDINVPASSAADINTGTATNSAVTPDALAGSNLGTKTIMVLVSDPAGVAITTGDGKAYVRITSDLNGMNLVGCGAVLDTAGSGGGFLCQLRRKRSGSDVDMLSTRISLDSAENDSADAASAAVINAANDDVATGDRIYIDLDGVPTTAKGLTVWMQYRLP